MENTARKPTSLVKQEKELMTQEDQYNYYKEYCRLAYS